MNNLLTLMLMEGRVKYFCLQNTAGFSQENVANGDPFLIVKKKDVHNETIKYHTAPLK